MKVLHIVGRKKHGKTALIVELIGELTRRGVRVGTVKHCGHEHELDTPGKDSFQHRRAGASAVAVLTPGLTAVYQPPSGEGDPYAQFRGAFERCDLVLIEGHVDGPGPKLEVWRQAAETPPLAVERKDIVGIVSNDTVDLELPVWPRSDVSGLAGQVLTLAEDI